MYFYICFALLMVSAIANGQVHVDKNPLCKVRNTYMRVDGKCDAYLECRDYHLAEMQCPDGLNFNPNAVWPSYACGYPQDVPCLGRGVNQPAQPTAECEHQYGYYVSPEADPNDCGHYRVCNGGRAFEMFCPTGLAFNPVTAQCDWPELVPTCNVETYLGEQCPPAAFDEDGNPVVTNHKYQGDCYSFYSCMNGHARILSCDIGLAFNPVTARCEDADRVQCDSMSVPKYK